MAQHTGNVEGREANNITVCGKRFYVPSDKIHLFEKYPTGSSVTLTEVKGTVTMITPLNGNAATGTTAAPVKAATKTNDDKIALEKFRQLPEEEQNRLIAKVAREILEDPKALREISSILASAICRKIEEGV
jgi:hypothetical protein